VSLFVGLVLSMYRCIPRPLMGRVRECIRIYQRGMREGGKAKVLQASLHQLFFFNVGARALPLYSNRTGKGGQLIGCSAAPRTAMAAAFRVYEPLPAAKSWRFARRSRGGSSALCTPHGHLKRKCAAAHAACGEPFSIAPGDWQIAALCWALLSGPVPVHV